MRNNYKKAISLVLTFCMVLSCASYVFAADYSFYDSSLDEFKIPFTKEQSSDEYIVVLQDPKPVLTLLGDAKQTQTKAVQKQIDKAYTAIEKLGIEAEIYCEYKNIFTGFSAKISYEDVQKLVKDDLVKAVYPVVYYDAPDAEVLMESVNEATNVNAVYEDGNGLKGSGIVVAVVDTGVTLSHVAFDVYEGCLSDAALSQADIQSFIDTVGYGTTYSEKILFGYNYADHNEYVDDTQGHGSHVSGTILGYVPEGKTSSGAFRGVAPDAQLLAMKVFSDEGGGASDYDIFRALDDAMAIGADVINLSLGNPRGFTYDSDLESELFGNVYKRLDAAGIVLCISAGNESNMSEDSSNFAVQDGKSYVTSDYSDYGVLGSPSTYYGNLSIASADTVKMNGFMMDIYSDGNPIKSAAYTEGSSLGSFAELFGTSPCAITYVDCGKGLMSSDVNEFDGLDLNGKVALIERGVDTFDDKVSRAVSYGAIAAMIYNNTDGLFSTSVDSKIPFICLGRETGLYLKECINQGESEATVTMAFSDEAVKLRKENGNVNAGKISRFSSWGCTPDLELKPNLTGIGGNVLSVKGGTYDEYVLMSGTSMASPGIAGCMALLLEQLRCQFPSASKYAVSSIAESILKSTSNIIIDDDQNNYPFSPRVQGTGLADVARAVWVAKNICVESECAVYMEDAMMNLYDSLDGSFDWTFTLENAFEGQAFTIEPIVLMDILTEQDYQDVLLSANAPMPQADLASSKHMYNTIHSEALDSSKYTFVSTVGAVQAGGECQVECHLELSEDVLNALTNLYNNGFSYGQFLEGFVIVKEEDAEEELCHGAFMGYVGNWTEAPILEQYDWRSIRNATWIAEGFTQIYNAIYTDSAFTLDVDRLLEVNTDYNFAAAVNGKTGSGYIAGTDSFLSMYAKVVLGRQTMPIFNECIAINNLDPEGINTLMTIPMRLRNARHTYVIISDANNGNVYDVIHSEYDRKSTYVADSNPQWLSNYYLFSGGDAQGEPLPNNTNVKLSYYVNLDYKEDEFGKYVKDNGPKALLNDRAMNKYCQWEVPCFIDSEFPQLAAVYNASTKAIDIEATDNHFLTAIVINSSEGAIQDIIPVLATEAATSVSGLEAGTYHAIARDAASNETVVEFVIPSEGGGEGTQTGPAIDPQPQPQPQPYNPPSRPNKPVIPEDPKPQAETKAAIAFFDVSEDSWYYDDVNYVFGKDYMKGVGGDLFGANVDMTRGMLLTILYRMAGSPKVSGKLDYPDVYSDQYYSDAVIWAVQNGIASGYGTGFFGPDDKINREDAVTLFYRYAKYKGMDAFGRADLSMYVDIVLANDYAVDALSWAKDAGLINGTWFDTISPKKLITRSEMAALIHRLDMKK